MNETQQRIQRYLDIPTALAALIFGVAGFLLIRNNLPAFSPALPAFILWTVYFGSFILLAWANLKRKAQGTGEPKPLYDRIGQALLYLIGAVLLPVLILRGAVIDYYQPLSLYDVPIYLTILSWLMFMALFIIQALRALIGRPVRRSYLLWPMLFILLPVLVPVFRGMSHPKWSSNVDETVLFQGGEGGYRSYRIPGLVVIPAGSTLADGTELADDALLAFVEARREGSLDQGDIDLIMRRSEDGGITWEEPVIVRRWEEGKGKIGDPTPVFQPELGMLVLAHGAQAHGEKYKTWLMYSASGGLEWSDPFLLGEGVPGPGHGTVVVGGALNGRIVLPAHAGNDGFAWISDDGKQWRRSTGGYPGNESLFAPLGEGELAYTARVPQSVAKPHGRMWKFFGTSVDGGDSWKAHPTSDVITPICMSGLTGDGKGTLWFVNPATVRTRARLSLRESRDGGLSWSEPELLFPGPGGYADLATASDGGLYILAENGRVEYDERITFGKIER